MRFVHLADVHLDTPYGGRSEPVRKRLREASREAFAAAVDLAIREDAAALLIAGDLFDGDRLSFQTERFLIEQAQRLGDHGVTVVYATGNHDPGAPDAGPRPLEWPTSVRIASDATPRRFLVHDRQGEPVGYVTAVGHAHAAVTEDLSRSMPPPSGDLPEVALLHTQVHSAHWAEKHHRYAPSELTWLERAGFDYWALGHVHVCQELAEDPPIWYSGSLQGRTHADQGERGALLVDLSDRRAPVVSFRPLAPVRWTTLEVDKLDGVTSLDGMERRIATAWSGDRSRDPGRPGTEWMVRVLLSGPCPLWQDLRVEENQELLARELGEILGALDVVVVTDRVHPLVAVDEHRARPDVLGEALRLWERVVEGSEGLEIPAGSLAGLDEASGSTPNAYVRELLSDSEGEIVAAMLEEASG